MLSENEIAARLNQVRARIEDAGRRARRDPASVRLVIASKTQPPDAIRAAWTAGAREFGENYVQEALEKQSTLADLRDIQWHLIGHLQTNKARVAAASFVLIHSLDSARLADALARAQREPRVPALIEVNLGGEASKTGVNPNEVEALIGKVRDKVDLKGLMTIPPPTAAPELARPYFVRLREMRDRFAIRSGLALSELSMGMTDDFEIGIEEGATLVRVGRAIFGERIR
jgi:PLP dependent protein